MFTNIRMKIRDFFRKYKYFLILGAVALVIVVSVNEFLKEYEEPVIPEVVYEPNKPIINEKEKVPEKEQEQVQDIFEEYVGYCNKKEYEKAYNMLSTECKEIVYPTLASFQEYIEIVFDKEKIYNIQNMSNINGKYIYRVRFLDDILATGLTGEESLWYDEDIITIVTEEDGKKLNIRELIGKDQLNKVYEDDYMRIEIEDRYVQYEAEIYHVKITNRSEYTIVMADNFEKNELTLRAGGQVLSYEKEYNNKIIIKPNATGFYTLYFGKNYDLSAATDSMDFNKVRILKSYSGTEETRQEEIENAEKVMSLKLGL